MSCKTYKNMLHSYIRNELSTMEEAAVKSHLKTCPDCGREVEEIKKLQAAISTIKQDKIQLDGIKVNIMNVIKTAKKAKTAVYDFKVLSRLGTSLVACGILAFLLNLSSAGSHIDTAKIGLPMEMLNFKQKIVQPAALLNESLTGISNKIIDLNGISFRLEQKIKGGR